MRLQRERRGVGATTEYRVLVHGVLQAACTNGGYRTETECCGGGRLAVGGVAADEKPLEGEKRTEPNRTEPKRSERKRKATASCGAKRRRKLENEKKTILTSLAVAVAGAAAR